MASCHTGGNRPNTERACVPVPVPCVASAHLRKGRCSHSPQGGLHPGMAHPAKAHWRVRARAGPLGAGNQEGTAPQHRAARHTPGACAHAESSTTPMAQFRSPASTQTRRCIPDVPWQCPPSPADSGNAQLSPMQIPNSTALRDSANSSQRQISNRHQLMRLFKFLQLTRTGSTSGAYFGTNTRKPASQLEIPKHGRWCQH